MKKVKGRLILENGMEFNGYCFGHLEDTVGEVVFNTAMTGYQETLSDPSYKGQVIVMTYPLVGNYGVNFDDMESKKIHASGFIVREVCENPSNFRKEMSLDGFLKQNKILGLYGIDTRALTKVLREQGVMKGIITTKYNLTEKETNLVFDNFSFDDAVYEVATKEVYTVGNGKLNIAVLDFGVKSNILRELAKRDCTLTVFPADTKAEEILNTNPDGIFLTNGPGDPEKLPEIVKVVDELIEKKPVTGICLGHQLICLSQGSKIEKLKFGHHGANHPIKDLRTGKVFISSQNHNYIATNLPSDLEEIFVNVNDKTLEGIKHKSKPIMSVQFHPEASPGPLDSNYIFDEFIEIIKGGNKNA